MRIPEQILKCIGFVAEIIPPGNSSTDVDWQGTGFVVTVPSTVDANRVYPFFVTAAHMAEQLEDREIKFSVNKRGGGTVDLVMASDRWFFHPSDKTADVAVLPFHLSPDLDILGIGVKHFLTPKAIVTHKVGLGDEVFITGLFTYAPGNSDKRNTPIVRHGNIAMLPDEPIQVDDTFADVYLVEARSIGGLSGSPVFVRPTMALPENRFGLGDKELLGLCSEVHLLGLMHGHWDIRESDMNKAHFTSDRRRGVNMGIGVVVPAYKILETLQHPGIIQMIEMVESNLRADSGMAPQD